jgi:hypothetical protein
MLANQTRFDKPHRSAIQAPLMEQERERRLRMESHHDNDETSMAPPGRLLMESHHDGDETKGSVYSCVKDYIEAREAA